jgi:MYXO-CTERM domain-containing protein
LPAGASAVAVAGLLLAAASGPAVVLTLQDPAIDESSGLAVSAVHGDLVWTHNDGGDVARVFGLDRDGVTAATVTLAGVDPYDPEALAPGPGPDGEPALFLGDTGDNLRERPDISVFRFDEPPALGDSTVDATWYRFTYPDGPHDAEALLVAPDGRLMVATKGISGQGLYRAPRELVTEDQGTNRLRRIASVPSLVTDGAYLPDGRFVLRTYSAVFVYDRPGHEVARADLPGQEQGESIAADGDRLLVGSEGVHSQVISVPVPGGAGTPSPAPSLPSSSTPTARPGRRADDEAGSPATYVAAGGLALLGVLAAVAVRRRRSSRGS